MAARVAAIAVRFLRRITASPVAAARPAGVPAVDAVFLELVSSC
jgi:hypothetical protein